MPANVVTETKRKIIDKRNSCLCIAMIGLNIRDGLALTGRFGAGGTTNPSIQERNGGPLIATAIPALTSSGGQELERKPVIALCRCGASKNKPYCDGSHHEIEFEASGEHPPRDTDMPKNRDGKLDIRPQPNGPLAISGHLEICGGSGTLIERSNSCRLCRCGASANKPFCDGLPRGRKGRNGPSAELARRLAMCSGTPRGEVLFRSGAKPSRSDPESWQRKEIAESARR